MSKQVIIVGGGYSVNDGIQQGLWQRIKGKTIWSCNYAFMTMPYLPTRELWVDRSFFKNNIDKLNELANKNVEIVCKFNTSVSNLPKTQVYVGTRKNEEYFGKEGIIKNKIFVGQQGFVGTFALHVAICEGYNEIFLLGFDYGIPLNSTTNQITHYYQGNLKVISSGVGRPNVYIDNNKIKSAVDTYSIFLQETDIKIWNVSPKSNIQCFDKITYEQMFNKINEQI